MSKPISEDTIEAVRSRVDIVELIGDYVHLKKSGKNFLGLCPFHSEKTPSFSVSPDKHFYHCFGCGAGGNVFTFLMEMEGYSFSQAVRHLAEKVDVPIEGEDLDSPQKKQNDAEKEWVFKAHHLTAQLFQHMLLKRREGAQALEYLYKRGLTKETIDHFQIGYAPEAWDFLTNFFKKRDFPLHVMAKGGLIGKQEGKDRYYDRFRGRIMFPIRNRQGHVIAFQGRIIEQGEPKYLNSPETILFQKNRQLYHFQNARKEIRHKQTAVLFEGCMDVLSAYQAGIKHGTATFGTSLSEEQARMIARNAKQVIICYDGDDAGIGATERSAETLMTENCLVKVGVLPTGYDPDDYIREKGGGAFEQEVLGSAVSFTAFQLNVLRQKRNMNDESERLVYIEDALRLISRLQRAVERDHYLRQLADEFSLSLSALKQEQFKIYKAEKKQRNRHKGEQSWHNSRNNTSKHLIGGKLLPAYQNAERMLLAHMLRDRDIADEAAEKVGSRFNVDEHNALAAYIYAFYAEGHNSDVGLFLSRLQDTVLIELTTDLSSMTLTPTLSKHELYDLIERILQYPEQQKIEQKMSEKQRAEQQGNVIQAAQIAMDVVQMKMNLQKQRHDRAQMFRKEGE
jgi:DNA primase